MKIKKLRAYLAAGLLAISGTASALPQLNFAGLLSFDPLTGLVIDANLTGTFGFDQPPVFTTPPEDTVVSLAASLTGFTSTPDKTFGFFGNATFAEPDLSITDARGQVLITGDINSLLMSGNNDFNLGKLEGYFTPLDGLLFDQFGSPSSVFAFVLDLEIDFNDEMFKSGFEGNADGYVVGTEVSFPPAAIPEPNLLILLGTGFLLLFRPRRRS